MKSTNKVDRNPTSFYKGAREAWEWARDRKPDQVLNSTALWYLPKELRQPFEDADPKTGLGPCSCRYCSPSMEKSASNGCWDTLAVGFVGSRLVQESAWIVHAPDLGGRRPKREQA